MIHEAALEIIKRNEGCELEAYRDVVGVLTIGYGHTGPDVVAGKRITQEQADALLAYDIRTFEDGVRAASAPCPENQIGAMVSLAYNIGLGAFRGSTVLRRHNSQDFRGAADAFLMWNKAGGRELTGLTRRRHEERALYLSAPPKPTYDRYLIAKALQTALLPVEPKLVVDGQWGNLSRMAYEKFNRGE